MRYSKINNTNLTASKLVLGTDHFGTLVGEQDAFSLMDSYCAAGGNVIDTASVYADWLGQGKSISEKTIGKWLTSRGNRSAVILATKGGHHDLSMLTSRLDHNSVREDFENSLRNLQTNYIDIYYLHKDDVKQSPESLIEMLQEVIPEEQAHYLGVSNWTYDRIKRANEHAKRNGLRPIIASQIQHSIAAINKTYFGISAMTEDAYRQYVKDDLNVFAFSSQAKGFFAILENGGVDAMPDTTKEIYLNDTNLRRYQKLRALADQRKEAIPTLVVAALISDPKLNTFAQIGPQNMKELSASLMGTDVVLSEEERKSLMDA